MYRLRADCSCGVSIWQMTSIDVNITIIVDNHAGNGLTGEHGLSMWIQADGKTILFDTGQGSALKKNAHALGLDLGKIDALILSHGHYDHTGGIAQVLREAPEVDVYCHPGVVRPRYAIRGGTPKAIQMPKESKAAMDTLSSKCFHWARQPMMLSDVIGITGHIPRKTEFEDSGGPFYLDPEGKRPDLIDDDIALWIQTDQGLVVCLGCCHAGLVNTIQHVRSISGTERIHAVIGGLHLMSADSQRIERTVGALRSYSPNMIVPCHCTGDNALASLMNALGERVVPGAAGETYQFE
jgi:7,8-dihydropterin-6-yl-methyl-4-(beta-D-ribofuranosyl)aminobenzene 5'-phosphate synthase